MTNQPRKMKLFRLALFKTPGAARYSREVKPITADELVLVRAANRAKAEFKTGSDIVMRSSYRGAPRMWVGRCEEIAS